MRLLAIILTVFLSYEACAAQKSICVGFYNVENLYDTINEPGSFDDEFTPRGSRKWDTGKYYEKLDALAGAISLFDADILGVCEVENMRVLEDLVVRPSIQAKDYRAVHYDSPDLRGSDVALLYRADRVEIISSEPIVAPGGRITRDILRVEGLAKGLRFSIYVVHMPSRRGNDPAATRQRHQIAALLTDLCAAQLRDDPQRCVVVCGDFNDNPNSKLLRGAMPVMYNASAQPHAQGKGSYAWRDVWQMYDQIFVSSNMTGSSQWHLDGDLAVVSRPQLLQSSGRFASYPLKWKISDHLPVAVKFVKK